MKEALDLLQGFQQEMTSAILNLPHYKVDCNIDGVVVFKCSEQGEVTPILCSVHSVSKSAKEEDKDTTIILETRFPFVVGFFHGKTKPEPEDLCSAFIQELDRLDPDNNGPETAGRKCTAKLHCMKCDTPIRYIA